MDLSDNEKITVASYDSTAKKWDNNHDTKNFWGEGSSYFLKQLPKGKVLEIGCGAGRDAKSLIKHGYDYTGTDISENLLSIARKVNPGSRFERKNLYELDYGPIFDGFWCAAVLIHVPRSKIHLALKSIKKNLKPGAIGFISVKEGRGEMLEERKELDGKKFYFVFWDDETFGRALIKNGFNILKKFKIPFSVRSTWLVYIVKTKV